MRTHDFRNGYWGHALHRQTWRVHPAMTAGRLWWRKTTPERASVMVHCSPMPEVGDRIVYASVNGDRCATVADVRPCGNPEDMHTIWMENLQVYKAGDT